MNVLYVLTSMYYMNVQYVYYQVQHALGDMFPYYLNNIQGASSLPRSSLRSGN